MDNSVALVQAYLRVNGCFTVAECPVIEALRYRECRTLTDLDILASRLPGASRLVPGENEHSDQALFAPDLTLDIPIKNPDMIIGEIKEGRAKLNRERRTRLSCEWLCNISATALQMKT